MKLKATQGRLIVQVDKEEKKSKGGIILSKPTNQDFHTGTVIDVGSPKKDDLEVFNVGDRVAWQSYSGVEYLDGDVTYLVINRFDIIAFIHD